MAIGLALLVEWWGWNLTGEGSTRARRRGQLGSGNPSQEFCNKEESNGVATGECQHRRVFNFLN